MSSDRLRFEIGTVTEFTAPNGRRYFRGDIGGLRVTFVDEPEREPADGGRMRLSVWASPAPLKARHIRVPAPEGPPAELEPAVFRATRALTQAERLRAAADDVLTRLGRLPAGGDRLDDVFTSEPADDECEDGIPLLERPLI